MTNEHELLEEVWQLLTDVTNTLVQEKLELLKRYISLEDKVKAMRKEAEKPSLLNKPSDEINPPIAPPRSVLPANDHFDHFPEVLNRPKEKPFYPNDLPFDTGVPQLGLKPTKPLPPESPIPDDQDCPF